MRVPSAGVRRRVSNLKTDSGRASAEARPFSLRGGHANLIDLLLRHHGRRIVVGTEKLSHALRAGSSRPRPGPGAVDFSARVLATARLGLSMGSITAISCRRRSAAALFIRVPAIYRSTFRVTAAALVRLKLKATSMRDNLGCTVVLILAGLASQPLCAQQPTGPMMVLQSRQDPSEPPSAPWSPPADFVMPYPATAARRIRSTNCRVPSAPCSTVAASSARRRLLRRTTLRRRSAVARTVPWFSPVPWDLGR